MFDLLSIIHMIKRIVQMELLPGAEGFFIDIFETVKKDIRSQAGCLGLELLRSSNQGETSIWTISLWQSIDDLETYRASALFQKTWAEVKPLFSSKARAWTLEPIDILP
jgi:(4S)-4-hydroxy-5-phosphonooxypentane-2,3-dione isomerase